jgi:hypothetical protein
MKGWTKSTILEVNYESKFGRIYWNAAHQYWSVFTPLSDEYVGGFKSQFAAAKFLREIWPEECKTLTLDAIRNSYIAALDKVARKYGASI